MPNLNGHLRAFVRSDARAAIAAAFNVLVLERGYDTLSVRDIIARAGVARSTFYEHFSSKDELLRDALSPLFTVIAATAGGRADPARLAAMLEHFAQQRALALRLFASRARDTVADTLAGLIDIELSRANGAPLKLDRSLVAAQYARGHIGLIAAWLASEPRAPARRIAAALAQSTAASTRALRALDG